MQSRANFPLVDTMKGDHNEFDQNFSIVYNQFSSVDNQPLFPGVLDLISNLLQGGLIEKYRKV